MDRIYLKMNFVGLESAELGDTEFMHPTLTNCRRSIRGKSCGAYYSYGSFQWTRAVKAISWLLLKNAQSFKETASAEQVLLVGRNDTLASSLDYALDKQPLWLLDMFGLDNKGSPLVQRLLRRSNPGRKRPGPTAISLNTYFIPLEAIEISWNGQVLQSAEQLEKLANIVNWGDEDSCASIPRSIRGADGGIPERISA